METLVALLMSVLLLNNACGKVRFDHEPHDRSYLRVRSFEGYFNNPSHPEWGSVGQPITDGMSGYVYYPDGTKNLVDGPNAREVSSSLLRGEDDGVASDRFSSLFAFFGQLVSREIMDIDEPSCPREIYGIDVSNDVVFNRTVAKEDMILMPVYRTKYDKTTGKYPGNPRKQINGATSWIDGSFIYGPSDTWTDALRKFEGGLLDLDERGLPPLNRRGLPLDNFPPTRTHKLNKPSKFWAVGDRRAHENPALLSLSILFMRYHNAVARNISNEVRLDGVRAPNDREIFIKARAITTAVLQSIIMYEWLPVLLGKTAEDLAYTEYLEAMDPQVDSMYAAVTSQWIMTLIPPAIAVRSEYSGCQREEQIRLCESWFDGQHLIEQSNTDLPKGIIHGLAAQPAMKEDHFIVEDILDYHYGPLHFSKTDGVAEFIMRGRDFGIKAGQFRKAGNQSYQSWNDMVPEEAKIKLKNLYNDSLSDVDMFLYALFEKDSKTNSAPGHIVKNSIERQLTRVRNADFFWFENRINGLYDEVKIDEIRSTKIADVISAAFGEDTDIVNGFSVQTMAQVICKDSNFSSIDEPEVLTLKKIFLQCSSINATSVPLLPKYQASLSGGEGVTRLLNTRLAYLEALPTECKFNPLDSSELLPCSGLKTYDYFAGNEFAFIVSWIWIGLFPFAVIGMAYAGYILAERQRGKGDDYCLRETMKASISTITTIGNLSSDSKDTENLIYAEKWTGPGDKALKVVRIKFEPDKYVIVVQTVEGLPVRCINLAVYEVITVYVCPRSPFTAHVELPKSYDLVLRFSSHDQLQKFCAKLNAYVYEHAKVMVRQPSSWNAIAKKAVTKARRKEKINLFFRNVFAQAFNSNDMRSDSMSANRELVEFEISKEEFADSLGMKGNSKFVDMMFNVVDKQKRGFLRFREILELVIIMSKGSPDRKLELLFDIFDYSGDGLIAREEVTQVVSSLIDLTGSGKQNRDVFEPIVTEMYSCAGLADKDTLNFDEFKRLMTCRDENFVSKLGVDWKGVKKSGGRPKTRSKLLNSTGNKKSLQSLTPDQSTISVILGSSSPRMKHVQIQEEVTTLGPTNDLGSESSEQRDSTLSKVGSEDVEEPAEPVPKMRARSASLALPKVEPPKVDPRMAVLLDFVHYIENRKRELAVLFFFYIICIALFLERFAFYYHSNEHNGARATLSLGVCFARGAAEVISFTFSIMLVTMCYNVLRYLRETVLNQYIPFDKNIVFHKIVAWTALAFTAVHVIAYGFNYYFLASGPASHACFFETLSYSSDGFIKIGPTLYTSLPGITGVLLVLTLMVMYIFASQTARRYMHTTFWIVHKLFIVLYVLMAMHGLLWLTQKPNFFWYFVGPCLMFVVDKVLSASRTKLKLQIIKADLLPSNVTRVMFKRPANFEYKSGMWVRIACDALGLNEYHPFTLTSSPHEDFLSLHIRGVGPWTLNLRKVMKSSQRKERELPNIYVDGPFGSGQQDWYNFEVSVLVGAGIGVTPYSSILKDFVHMMRTKNRFKIKCQKVYFIWSTNNQRSFEWLIDILKQVEEVDIRGTVSTNIFITQFFQGFDLRTSMLYVFEEHAKKLGGSSLFTGLKATTSFGRPNFGDILEKVSEEHLRVRKVGVFSCGPPGITKGVEHACIEKSASTHAQFQHHYENF